MKATPDPDLPGVLRIEPRVFADERGFFLESLREEWFASAAPGARFVQANHSRSARGTLRGLHYQRRPGQAKLIRVLRGAIWDVAVDIRPDSPAYGRSKGFRLAAEGFGMLFLPAGFAHGFLVESEAAEVEYFCTAYYDPAEERAIAWNDPDLAVDWQGVESPILSGRDAAAPSWAEARREIEADARA